MTTWTYRGIEMRSIAEARWAAFFDACGFDWQYEPINTGTYIPDFLLFGNEETLVEINGGATTLARLGEETAYVGRELVDHWRGNVLCLGAKPILERDGYGICIAGYMYESVYHPANADGVTDGEWWREEALLGRCSGFHDGGRFAHFNQAVGFLPRDGWYALRPSGCYQGGFVPNWGADDIEAVWAEATNRVRYEPAR